MQQAPGQGKNSGGGAVVSYYQGKERIPQRHQFVLDKLNDLWLLIDLRTVRPAQQVVDRTVQVIGYAGEANTGHLFPFSKFWYCIDAHV